MRRIEIRGAIWILLLMAVSCARYDQSTTVKNISEEQIILLKNESGKEPPHSIKIRVSGNIGGEAKMFLMLDGKPYKTEKIAKTVGFTWGGDWYSDTAEIKYEPTKVTGGKLLIEYRFYTIK